MDMTTTKTRLREATRGDLAGIWRVRYAVVENTLAPGRIEDDEVIGQLEASGRGWVVEEDGEIVAFAIGDAQGANVWALFVHPSAEGRGHGSLLHDTMVEWLWTNGLDTLWLSTGADTKARGFYERRGWRCVGTAGRNLVRLELTNAWS
jgi:GNAT superfamily N-acetyltransferase